MACWVARPPGHHGWRPRSHSRKPKPALRPRLPASPSPQSCARRAAENQLLFSLPSPKTRRHFPTSQAASIDPRDARDRESLVPRFRRDGGEVEGPSRSHACCHLQHMLSHQLPPTAAKISEGKSGNRLKGFAESARSLQKKTMTSSATQVSSRTATCLTELTSDVTALRSPSSRVLGFVW